MSLPALAFGLAIAAYLQPAPPASIDGLVMDASGKPLENARVDHTGKTVVAVGRDPAMPPSGNEIRTDSNGHFRMVTNTPAFVVRKPGYRSQRLLVRGDAQVTVTLERVVSTSRCKLKAPPVFKAKQGHDIDFSTSWYYIRTKQGKQGIISGSGPFYSWGAPADSDVWTSPEYSEIMYESGVVDAAGRSADGKYWRTRSIFGAAARYQGQTRENAGKLDCVMDRVPIDPR